MSRSVVFAMTILICWVAPPVGAQSGSAPSISLGFSHNDFRYVVEGCAYNYDFQEALPLLTLGTRMGLLRLGYGTQKADVLRGSPSLSMFECEFRRETDVYLARRLFSLPAALSLPFRTALDYRRLSVEKHDAFQGIPNLNLLASTLGAGLGLAVKSTHHQPRLTVSAAVVSSIGAMTDLSEGRRLALRLVRSTEFNCEVGLPRLWKKRYGVIVGFCYRSMRWTNDTPKAFNEVPRSITRLGEVPKRRGQIALTLGVCW